MDIKTSKALSDEVFFLILYFAEMEDSQISKKVGSMLALVFPSQEEMFSFSGESPPDSASFLAGAFPLIARNMNDPRLVIDGQDVLLSGRIVKLSTLDPNGFPELALLQIALKIFESMTSRRNHPTEFKNLIESIRQVVLDFPE